MAVQKPIDLNEPLDQNSEAAITKRDMNPSLATAALTLHGDYYRLLQSLANKAIVWHPIVQTFIVGVLVTFGAYKYADLYAESEDLAHFFSLASQNLYILTTFFPAVIFVAGTVGLVSFILSDEFRSISDNLALDTYMLKLFRFPLRVYANANGDEEKSKDSKTRDFVTSANKLTELVEYRGSPIAVVTVIPLPDLSNLEVFYAKITGLHVRKVYRGKVDLESDLVDTAIGKAQELSARYIKDNKLKIKNIKVVLQAEAYTIDPVLPAVYRLKGFKQTLVSHELNPFGATKSDKFLSVFADSLIRLFRISRVKYEKEI